MRRAGFEVRVLPLEWGSFEENPPTLVDFLRRDLRWCRGNLQYFKLLSTPGLTPTSRFQLIWAIAMFIGAPAWTAIIALAALTTLQGGAASFPVRSTQVLYCLFLGFYFAPKLAGYIDVARTPGGFARYGGAVRFFAGALIEALLSFVIGAAATLQITLYLLSLPFRARYPLGRTGARRPRALLAWRGAGDVAAIAVRDAGLLHWRDPRAEAAAVVAAADGGLFARHSRGDRHGLAAPWPMDGLLAPLRHPRGIRPAGDFRAAREGRRSAIGAETGEKRPRRRGGGRAGERRLDRSSGQVQRSTPADTERPKRSPADRYRL